jgi:hypothetical protein
VEEQEMLSIVADHCKQLQLTEYQEMMVGTIAYYDVMSFKIQQSQDQDQIKYMVWKNSAAANAKNDTTQSGKINNTYAFLEQSGK